MLQVCDEDGLLDLAEPRCREELGEVSLASAGEIGLIVDAGVQIPDGPPEQGERAQAAGVIPHTRGDDTIRPG